MSSPRRVADADSWFTPVVRDPKRSSDALGSSVDDTVDVRPDCPTARLRDCAAARLRGLKATPAVRFVGAAVGPALPRAVAAPEAGN